MAGRARLIPRARLAALLALVLLVHVLALQWLAQQLEQRSALRALATPMFTRLLQSEAPAAVPAPASAAAARARRKRSAISSVANSSAVAPAAPASAPMTSAEAASAAEPAPPDGTPVASTPENTTTTATSPMAAASAAASSNAAHGTGLGTWPADTRLTYQLGGYFRGDLHGSARVQWQRQDDRYQNRVEIDLTLLASVTLTSQGEVTPQGLVPRIYEELRRSGPRIARLGENSITFNDGRTTPRPEGVQDTASQFVELSHRFATGQEVLEVGRSVSLWMARPGGLDLWTYDIVEREILQTPQLGAIEAFRLKPRPIPNPRGTITAEIWFAPSLQYLPVRIRVHIGEATYVDLLVEKIEQR